MIDVEINIIGVLAATVVAMLVGAIWYSKSVFGKDWMKLAKINEKRAKKEAPQAMLVMLILAFLASYVLAYLTYAVGFIMAEDSYMSAAIKTSLIVWAGFIFYAQVSNGVFEQRRKKLMAINVANSFVTFLLMGIVIGAIGI